jgi:hypothetical protein
MIRVWTPFYGKLLNCYGVHCKGDTTTTTTRNIPEQTADEASLQSGLMGYAGTGLSSASGLLDQANTGLANTYNPNWTTLGNNYTDSTNNALSNYNTNSANSLSKYETAAGNALNNYNGTMSGVTDAYQSLANGVLPTAYATNRQAALNADLTGTVGTALNGLGSRGVLNSSVTGQALNNISQNASNTLANDYTTDLGTESGLIGNQATQASNVYNTNYGNANGIYGNEASNNTNTYNNANTSANNLLTGASTAQTGSYYAPLEDLSAAGSEANSASNLFNTLYSGRMGTAGATQTSNATTNDGTKGAVGSLGSAAILACFIAGTKIRTPDGDKNIENVKVGDKVISYDGEQTVLFTQDPVTSSDQYYTVFGNGGKQVTTTASQPFITVEGDKYPRQLKHVLAEKELVYDLAVSGGNNYYANGFLVRGRE